MQMGTYCLHIQLLLGEGSINKVEMETTLFGIAWCIQMDYGKVILEVDSELVHRQVTQQTGPPWHITHTLSRLLVYTSQLQEFKCSHTYREENFVADTIGKFSHSLVAPQVYFDPSNIPKEARDYYTLDKMDMKNFRRKKLKKNKEPP